MRDLKELASPQSWEEFWEKKDEYGDRGVVIAGGTEIVNDPPPGVECLIDIRQLGLDSISETETSITIGATATMEKLTRSPQVASLAQGMLCRSTCQGWPAPVRSAATLGGNLAGGDPFADTPAALLALDAEVVLQTSEGPITVPIKEFFLDYRKTAAEDAVLVEVRIPKTPPEAKGVFLKCAPGSIEKAMVNVGVYAELVDGRIQNARVAVGAITRIPQRVPEVESLLRDHTLLPDLVKEAADIMSRQVEPMLDIRASVEQRRSLLTALFRRAAHQLAQAS